MSATGPLATVVIPTHNRAATLLATLEALEAQTCDTQAFEVVVVPNGCTDDTMSRLQAWQASFRLRVAEIDTPSASLARNTGVDHARAPLIIFLDDDIAPAPSFVSAHLSAHDVHAGVLSVPSLDRVVIGYLPALLQTPGDRFAITLRAWWEAMFDSIREPGHRFAYTDLLSGNFSMSRTKFLELGGFDVSLRCHEDYELGYRLLASGAQFAFAEAACGTHADVTRLARACERKRQEGRADVQLAQRHPQLRSVLPLSRPRTFRQRLSRGLAFHLPSVGDLGARAISATLPLFDQVGATATWLRVLYALFGYWYERGLADTVGTEVALAALLEGAGSDAPAEADAVEIDLAGGIKSALHEADRIRPLAVTLCVGPRRVASVPWQPGAERLAGRHIAAALVQQHHRPVFDALRAIGHVRLTAPAPVGPDAPAPDAHTPGSEMTVPAPPRRAQSSRTG
jgi:GT2 family glycosyltransferase